MAGQSDEQVGDEVWHQQGVLCKARGMRQEVDSRDEVMHSEMSDWWSWAEQICQQAVQIKKGRKKNHKQILTWTFVLLSFAPVLRNESSRSKSSRERKFHTWNFRSRERMVLGAKSPVTVKTRRQTGRAPPALPCPPFPPLPLEVGPLKSN